jgi:hypothetical protein
MDEDDEDDDIFLINLLRQLLKEADCSRLDNHQS